MLYTTTYGHSYAFLKKRMKKLIEHEAYEQEMKQLITIQLLLIDAKNNLNNKTYEQKENQILEMHHGFKLDEKKSRENIFDICQMILELRLVQFIFVLGSR